LTGRNSEAKGESGREDIIVEMLTCIKRRREWLGAPRGTLGPRDVARSRRVDLQTWTKSNAARLCTPFRIQYDLPDLDPTTWLTHLSYKGSPFKPTSPQNALVLVHSCTTLSKCLDSWHTHLPLLFSSSFPNLFFLYIYPIIHSVYD